MAFLLLSLSALARLIDYAVAKIDGGTNDRGSKIFVICELEGIRHGGFSSVVGDGGVDLSVDAGEERVRSDFEKGLLSEGILKEVEVSDEEGVGRGRALDTFDVCVFVKSLELDALFDLGAVVDVVGFAQSWSFGKRCCGQYCFLQALQAIGA